MTDPSTRPVSELVDIVDRRLAEQQADSGGFDARPVVERVAKDYQADFAELRDACVARWTGQGAG